MHRSFAETYPYEYDYTFNSLQRVKPIDGEMVSFAPFTSDKDPKKDNTILVYGVQKDAKLISLNGSNGTKLSMDQVIITRALADKNNIHEGDYLHLKSKLTSREITIKVDKIAEFYLGQFVYMPLDRFNTLSGFPKGSYLEVYSTKKLDIAPGRLISTINKNDMLEGYKAMLKPIEYMMGIFGFLAFVIGLIIIYVVTSLIIEENKGNISLFKILGYRTGELYALVLNTNTWFVILGYILAIPLAFYSLGVFFGSMTADMNMNIPVKLNKIYILIGFFLIFLTYEFAKFLNRKKITNIKMSDSLKNSLE